MPRSRCLVVSLGVSEVSEQTYFTESFLSHFHGSLWWWPPHALPAVLIWQRALQGQGMMGAGDLLMSFLGVVILSFGFRIFGQRRLMKRHAPEIFGATILSATFSMFSTALAARAMGLAPGSPQHFHTLRSPQCPLLCSGSSL